MTDLPFKFDAIGAWSELKLEIIEKYGAAYTKAFARTRNLKKYYIDRFSGAGMHVSKWTKAAIEGSPARALKITPPFDALCLLDPYGLDLDWDVIRQAGQSGAVDLFLNFPVLDMNRNAIWRDSEKAPAGGVDRMNKFWGDDSWRQAAYAEARQRSSSERTWRSKPMSKLLPPFKSG